MAAEIPPASTGLGSFLSHEQQKAFTAALDAKSAEAAAAAKAARIAKPGGGGKQAGGGGGSAKSAATGNGKFTWGSIFYNGDHAEAVLDRNDPNYDSDEEQVVVLTHQDKLKGRVQAYKLEVASIVEEYFASGDISEVATALDDLGEKDMLHYFVKKLLILALDRKDREREMASVLLSSLYAEVIPSDQVRKGFQAVVESIEDTVLDVPDAAELLSLFISRAVVDDVLPPATSTKISDSTPTSALLKSKVEAFLHNRHSAEKMLRCWGPGAGVKHQETKEAIQNLLKEYLTSFDMDEASRCLMALSVPFFHHELVKQAVHLAMNSGAGDQREAILGLLDRLCTSVEVSQSQLAKGIRRVAENVGDLCLDNPAAKGQFEEVLQEMRAARLIDEDTLASGLGASASNAGAAPGAPAPASGHSVSAFKAACAAAIREYFDSSDASEVASRLTELDDPGLLHILVKQAIVMSLDRKDHERELISTLLCSLLTTQIMSADQLQMGMTRLLVATDDLLLDCPDAVRLLSLFLGRAIVDEILPPSFLTQVLRSLPATCQGGISVVRSAGTTLSARHGAERLAECWRGGSLSLDQVKVRIKGMLAEYLAGRDVAEAARCLTELNMPFFNHEFVKQAVELAFEQASSVDALSILLSSLSSSGTVNTTQMTKGFLRIKSRLDEEAIDFGPLASETFGRLVMRGTQEGWLSIDPEA